MTILGCIACFIAGAAAATAAVFLCGAKPRKTEQLPAPCTEEEMPEKMKEQWVNFLSYDGSDQRGGF